MARQSELSRPCLRATAQTCMLFPKSFQSNVYIWSMSRPTPVSRARSKRPAPCRKHQTAIGSSLLTVAYTRNLIRYSNYAHCRSHGHVGWWAATPLPTLFKWHSKLCNSVCQAVSHPHLLSNESHIVAIFITCLFSRQQPSYAVYMAYRSVYLAKYRGSPSQRAHFAIFIPNSTNDNPDLDK